MPLAPPTVTVVPERWDKAEARRTCAPDETPGCRLRQAEAPSTAAIARGNRLWRAAEVIWRVIKLSYCNPMLERPDLVEDDYYRLRYQPRGY